MMIAALPSSNSNNERRQSITGCGSNSSSRNNSKDDGDGNLHDGTKPPIPLTVSLGTTIMPVIKSRNGTTAGSIGGRAIIPLAAVTTARTVKPMVQFLLLLLLSLLPPPRIKVSAHILLAKRRWQQGLNPRAIAAAAAANITLVSAAAAAAAAAAM